MEIGDWEIVRLELKYCERCGRLWLRQREAGEVYCGRCISEISDYPLYGRRIGRLRLQTDGTLEIGGHDGTVRLIDGGQA
jgi:hypothetical protein